MNKESANTMLKFLEEPLDETYGFFITNYSEGVISTIQSRCQLINVIFDTKKYNELNINEEDYNEYLKIAKKYIELIEKENKLSIIVNKKTFNNMEREEIKIIFQIILDIYYENIKSKNGLINKYSEIDLLNKYSTQILNKKIELIIEFLEKIDYNVNIDILLDSFVIEMEGINYECL